MGVDFLVMGTRGGWGISLEKVQIRKEGCQKVDGVAAGLSLGPITIEHKPMAFRFLSVASDEPFYSVSLRKASASDSVCHWIIGSREA